MAYVHPIEIRFADLDALGHVNHATMLSYVEHARVAWWQGYMKGRPFKAEGWVIAHVEIDYRNFLLLGEAAQVEISQPEPGNRSFSTAFRLLKADGTVVAEGRSVQVFVDLECGTARPISAEARAWMEAQR